jgi:ATP-binding cassette, subfamily B, multidrug efflux pump
MSEKKEKLEQKPQAGGPGSGHGFTKVVEKPKDFKGTINRLIKYLSIYKIALIFILTLAIGSTIFSIVGPKILGQATDTLAEGVIGLKVYEEIQENLPPGVTIPEGTTGKNILDQVDESIKSKIPETYLEYIEKMDISKKPSIDFNSIGKILLFVLGLYALSSIFYYIQGYIMAGITQKTIFSLRRDVSSKLDRLPMRYFDQNTHGEILSKVTNDIDTISNTLQQSLTQIIMSIVTVVGIVVMMLTISFWLTLITFLTLPLSALITAFIAKFSQREFKINQEQLGKLNSHVEEMYSGHKVIKSLNQEQPSIAKFEVINRKLYRASWRSQFISGVIMPLLFFVSNIGYVGVAVVGGLLTSGGLLSIGSIQAFMQYSRAFNQPITDIAGIFNTLQSTAAAAERVFLLLDEEEEIKEVENAKTLDNVEGAVKFENVFFSYRPDKPLIENMNISVKAGDTVAIVGPTGAGKTTLVNLLMRFYELGSGSIYIDGNNITSLKRSELRKQFGMVLQDTWLFNGSIKENIAYGRQGASFEDVISASKVANVDHFVRTLPQGYDTVINEEANNISAGQKQLLTIARAVLSNPPILILDEATSSVDTRTEVLIQKAMLNIMKGRTSFVIAHRLSTIKNADLILVMNNGSIVEQGTHKDLLKQEGFYYNLYNSQFDNKELIAG